MPAGSCRFQVGCIDCTVLSDGYASYPTPWLFANADGALVPGMFVSVRLWAAKPAKTILVPEDAISSDQSKRYVFVVTPSRKADYREVALGQEMDGKRVVLSGLHSGERIIVDGVQRVQPGAAVDPHLAGKLASN